MALSINSTYAGRHAGGMLAKAIASAKLGSGNYAEMHKTLGGKMNISTGSVADGILKAYTCDFVTNGTVNVEDRVLNPKKFSVQFEDCYDKFTTLWSDLEFSNAVSQVEMPATFGAFIVEEILKKVSLNFDSLVLNSVAANAGVEGEFDGLMTKATAVGTTATVVTATALTVSNIIAEMQKVYLSIKDEVLEKGDVKWFMNSGDLRKYKAALAASGNGIIAPNTNVDNTIFYDGTIELVPLASLASGKMLVASKGNIHIGTNYADDKNSIRLIDMQETTGDAKFRFRMDFVLDVDFAFLSEVVVYA